MNCFRKQKVRHFGVFGCHYIAKKLAAEIDGKDFDKSFGVQRANS
jgi:hypothetical protein